MGRNSTGIETAESSKRISLSYLLKHEYIKKGYQIKSKLVWNDSRGEYSGSAGIKTVYNNDEKYILLNYKFTDRRTGESENIEQRINLVSVPSNLGIGEVLYFECPFNLKLCRVLYNAYNSKLFKSRSAYRNRIYYNCQKASKRYYALERKQKLEKDLMLLEKKPFKAEYKGKVTRRQRRVNKMKIEIERFENKNFLMILGYLEKLSLRVNKK